MKKKRADFSQKIKKIISQRAAYRCSYPDCNATLIGPGMEPDAIENIGECAHIYAAQENAQWRYKSYLRMLGTAW